MLNTGCFEQPDACRIGYLRLTDESGQCIQGNSNANTTSVNYVKCKQHSLGVPDASLSKDQQRTHKNWSLLSSYSQDTRKTKCGQCAFPIRTMFTNTQHTHKSCTSAHITSSLLSSYNPSHVPIRHSCQCRLGANSPTTHFGHVQAIPD
jgi:hypothetical protein